ncbi:MAG: hypothetical protein E6230_02715 [Paenibacillus dendritiformis]|uniref:hypothetical protein n=1 Tax=uncultured Paenibacillus sp. TaxID=227322 RepID=UPI0025F723AE|nr:hypothetical protein [uncultured Paenibacillus sp.]MDU5141086.1 hypothetical protein [Paenibacillus dendritiformis]
MSNEPNGMTMYIEKLREILGNVPRIYDENVRKIEQLEKETSDLIHAIELLELDDTHAQKYACEIREARLDRRRRKDQNAVLKPLYDYIKANPKMVHGLRDVHESSKKAAVALEDRRYYPRIRMEMTEAFEEQARKGGDALGKEPDQTSSEGTVMHRATSRSEPLHGSVLNLL